MDDYQDAATRHLEDAELLFSQDPQRLANASHLFGVSAECALKAVARTLNPNATRWGRNGHLPKLFDELCNVAPTWSSNPVLAQSTALLRTQFASWDVGQRYHAQSKFTQATVTPQAQGARDTNLLMRNFMAGVI